MLGHDHSQLGVGNSCSSYEVMLEEVKTGHVVEDVGVDDGQHVEVHDGAAEEDMLDDDLGLVAIEVQMQHM